MNNLIKSLSKNPELNRECNFTCAFPPEYHYNFHKELVQFPIEKKKSHPERIHKGKGMQVVFVRG